MNTKENIEIISKYKSFFEKEDVNRLMNDINNHKLGEIFIDKRYTDVVSVDIPVDFTQNDIDNYHLAADLNPLLIQKVVDKAFDNNIPIHFIEMDHFTGVYQFLANIPGYIFPFIALSLLFRLLSFFGRGPSGPGNRGPNGFGGILPFNTQFEAQKSVPNVTLADWAGSPEVKEECQEVISYVYNKELYKKVGAEMPKGILLEGPPGTGKTMIAKAIASQTNSSFISVSSSEFVEVFVGVGAQKVRNLFEEARRIKPCVIFIDEIDAVGKQRGGASFRSGGNDEQEQTLNQLLYEMDGFNDNEDILVLAATNRKDVLDKALLRPGRFDRIIRVPLPDKRSREQILETYMKPKNITEDVNIELLADFTNGYSGADLKNLVNEAAILTARQNNTVIKEQAFMDALEKATVGIIKKNYTAPVETRLRVAYHESGHALLVKEFPQYFDLKKVSIQATYNGAGGYTIFNEKPEIQEGGLYTKDIFKKRLIISLGGKAAESIMYGDNHVSLGAVEDLKQANRLANQMVTLFGMGSSLEVFSADEEKQLRNIYSDKTKYRVDNESLALVNEAYKEAKAILTLKREELIGMAHRILL